MKVEIHESVIIDIEGAGCEHCQDRSLIPVEKVNCLGRERTYMRCAYADLCQRLQEQRPKRQNIEENPIYRDFMKGAEK